jgi:hypothetical protein
MSLITALLAKAMADRRGLPQEVSNRYLVTGYVLGAATSPVLTAVVTDQLAQRDAARLVTTPPGEPVVPRPAGGGQPLPTGNTVFVDDLTDTPATEEELQAVMPSEIAVKVEFVPSTEARAGIVLQQSLHGFVPAGTTIIFYIGKGTGKQAMPDVEEMKENDAKAVLTGAGFDMKNNLTVEERILNESNKALDGYVLVQEPNPAEPVDPATAKVTLYVGRFADGGSIEEFGAGKGRRPRAARAQVEQETEPTE